jgi:uncharacterized protein YqjF (DUF2071 family)
MPAFQMEWRDVLFASYPVDPATVEALVPDRLDVDTFDGDAYLSVVPFVISDIRPPGVPSALGLTTPELNLRTYVTCDGAAGVYFFSLDVDDVISALGARLFNHLPYYYADMEYRPGRRTRFRSQRRTPGARPVAFEATYGPDGEPSEADPGTVEHFLVERYRYFTEGPDGSIRYADIDHEPWRLRPAEWTVRTNTLFRANGFDQPDSDPVLSYSQGLPVRASASEGWDG